MPVIHVDGFATAKEAWEFLNRVEAAGPPGDPPCLTDDDDHIIATFFGHTLRESCSCHPTVGGIDGGMNDTLQYAGRIVGVGDFRPSFGRFQVTGFKVIELK